MYNVKVFAKQDTQMDNSRPANQTNNTDDIDPYITHMDQNCTQCPTLKFLPAGQTNTTDYSCVFTSVTGNRFSQ